MTEYEIIRAQFTEGEFDELMSYLNQSIEPEIVQAMKQYAKYMSKFAFNAGRRLEMKNVPEGFDFEQWCKCRIFW